MKTRPLAAFVLAALLIAAQGALALHAFEHDLGTPPGKVCGTCITGSQLAAGSVDTGTGQTLEPIRYSFTPTADRGFDSVHTAPVRQRGPPSSS